MNQVEELREKLKELSDKDSSFVLNFLFGMYIETSDNSEFMKNLEVAIDNLSITNNEFLTELLKGPLREYVPDPNHFESQDEYLAALNAWRRWSREKSKGTAGAD